MPGPYGVNVNLQRIGEILVRSFWLEKRLIDLIILKRHLHLKDDFNSGQISEEHGKLRLTWHKNTFAYVATEFLTEFQEVEKTDKNHVTNLNFLVELRDALSHGDISYYRDNVLFVAKDDKRLARFDKNTSPKNTGNDDGTRVVNFIEGNSFNTVTTILNDWEKIVEISAEHFGVNSEKIK